MKKIYMFCTAGASSSLIVKKMQDAAVKLGLDYDIKAAEYAQADFLLDAGLDMVLIAPQARLIRDAMVKKFPNIPVVNVDMMAYGMVNGEKIVKDVQKAFEEAEGK